MKIKLIGFDGIEQVVEAVDAHSNLISKEDLDEAHILIRQDTRLVPSVRYFAYLGSQSWLKHGMLVFTEVHAVNINSEGV